MRAFAWLPPHYDHGLMLSIHGEFDYVVPGHSRELLCNDVLEVNQISHALQCPRREFVTHTNILTCHF